MADIGASQEHVHDAHRHATVTSGSGGDVIDPVCGMTVNPVTSPHRFDHGGHTWHFCGIRCREKFAADPVQCLALMPPQKVTEANGSIYTCPMHPEIRQEGPGSCPICGMALEPLTVTARCAAEP